MKHLLKTSRFGKGRAAHSHIVLVDDTTFQAVCAVAQDHIHPIQFIQPQPAQTDEAGNIIQEEVQGGWQVLPDIEIEGVGHVHDGGLEEVEIKGKKKEEEDKDVINSVLTQYGAWREHERESYNQAVICDQFADGEQWEESIKSNLEKLERACLTINYTTKMLDELCGYERDERQTLAYSPVEDGDQRLADLYNVVKTHILEQCGYDQEKSDVFEDACRVGRGLFNIYIDFDNDLLGEIKVERFPWDGVVFAPHEKKDLSDCEGLIKYKWFSESKFEQLWPEKAKEMQEGFSDMESYGATVVHEDTTQDPYTQGDRIPTLVGGDPTVDLLKKEIRVYERWLRLFERAKVAINEDASFIQSLYGWSAKEIAQVETIQGLRIVEKTVQRIRITRCTAISLLSDENPADVPSENFHIVPVYAKKRGSKFWGKVRDAIDPQKEINHRHSQVVDIGNKMAAYGWFVDPTTFGGDPKAKREFIESSTKPGFVLEVADVGRPPVQVEGTKFPAELVQLLQLGTETLSAILNVTVDPNGANESGKALLERRRQRLIGNEFLFDNLSYAQVSVGRLLLPLIRKYYSAERIYRIVESKSQKQPVMIGGAPLEEWPKEEILTILENDEAEKYDVVVKETQSSPTVRMGVFLLLKELMESGAPIPFEPVLNLIPDLPEQTKQQLADAMAQQAQSEAQAQQMNKEMEENKALIAHGTIPPDVAARLQGATNSQQVQGDIGADQAIPPDQVPMAGM